MQVQQQESEVTILEKGLKNKLQEKYWSAIDANREDVVTELGITLFWSFLSVGSLLCNIQSGFAF